MFGLKMPDPEVAGTWHTQLGTRVEENGRKYKQAREFDKKGKPDQHEWSYNLGNSITKKREKIAKPLLEPTESKPKNTI